MHMLLREENIFQAAVREGKILTEPSGFSKSGKTRVCRAEDQRGRPIQKAGL